MRKRQKLTLTGWQGATSGLRVDAESRRRVFLPLKGVLRHVQVVLPGHGVQPCCRLTRTFWATCPEFRSAEIGKWMENRGDKPWPRGNRRGIRRSLWLEAGRLRRFASSHSSAGRRRVLPICGVSSPCIGVGKPLGFGAGSRSGKLRWPARIDESTA